MAKIYHITTSEHWEFAKDKGQYDFCSFESDGFIHCSTETQFLRIANGIFRGGENLVLLEIDEPSVNAPIKYENLEGGSEDFPHIYGPIPICSVTSVYVLEKNREGDFFSPLDLVFKYIDDSQISSELDIELRDLLSSCFTSKEDEVFRFQRFVKEKPLHRWIVYSGGKLIAHCALHEKNVIVDGITTPVGGVSEVCVLPAFRKQGIVKEMLSLVHHFLMNKQISISILFGDPKVYLSSDYRVVDNLYTNTFTSDLSKWQLIPGALIKEITSNSWPLSEVRLVGPLF